ncbi:hypothetical protein ACWIUD_05120 [Helicobacter sp. 23-1044]
MPRFCFAESRNDEVEADSAFLVSIAESYAPLQTKQMITKKTNCATQTPLKKQITKHQIATQKQITTKQIASNHISIPYK